MVEICHHNCLEELSAEHKTILGKLDELEKAITQPKIEKNKIKEFLDFTENFAEPHLQKEEKVLFPALEKKGIPREGGPIGVMLSEHETKRGYIKELEKALGENREEKIKKNAQAVIFLLREHIDKEENVLYPCAKDVLTKKELILLGHQCEKIKPNLVLKE